MPLPVLTHRDLARCDGADGAPAFVGYAGLVYDVSTSYHWRRGSHWVRHRAGRDLTVSLSQAPHGAEKLARFPVVGVLADG
jgi:predicted heme/steroid binding protein